MSLGQYYGNSCFIGGFALSANAVSSAKTLEYYNNWMAGAQVDAGDNAYYQATLRVLYMMLSAGTFDSTL